MQLWKVARKEVFKDRYKEFMRLENVARIMHCAARSRTPRRGTNSWPVSST
ncbi:hypothetical protein [Streptomyces sp. NPDC088727]|uniref:hypothetical protein n=1 Tax=Streptomyces sp. NPDC088727 TaxID=3365875 RepID=UPI003827722E